MGGDQELAPALGQHREPSDLRDAVLTQEALDIEVR